MFEMTIPHRGAAAAELKTGVVLSGGGARGAYEAGISCAVFEILRGAGRLEHAPFQICCGTSVGAIHAAHLGTKSHRPREGLQARELINLAHADVQRRADEVLAFFDAS